MKKMSTVKVASSGLAVVAMALSPVVASAATTNASTTVTANVQSTISMTTSSNVSFSITPVAGGAQSSSSDSVAVSTNDPNGYTLTLADTDTATSLTNGANTIAAHTGTQAAPTALANNSWGYRVDGVGGFGAGPSSALSNATSSTQTFAGLPSSSGTADTLKSTSATASNDTTTVWYSAKIDTTKPAGAYADSVTYTATGK